MLEKSSSLELTIQMPFELQEQTQQLAMQQSKTVSEIIHIALMYYLDNYQESNQPIPSELNLEQKRHLMRDSVNPEREQQAKILDDIYHARIKLPSYMPDSTTLLREDRDR